MQVLKSRNGQAIKEHPYGHYKFEVLAGLIITIVLLGAGVSAIYEAYRGFIKPKELEFSAIAFAVMITSAVVNEVMARVKISCGKKENSISLISDGTHSRVDVYASLGVIGGLSCGEILDLCRRLVRFLNRYL